MKHKYFKSLVVASAVFGLSFQAQAQDKIEVEKIRSKYDLRKLQQMKGNFQKNSNSEKNKLYKLQNKKVGKLSLRPKMDVLLNYKEL